MVCVLAWPFPGEMCPEEMLKICLWTWTGDRNDQFRFSSVHAGTILFIDGLLWRVDLGQQPDPHPAAPSLSPIGKEGVENRMKKLMG